MSDHGWLVAGPTAPEVVRRHYDEWAAGYDAELAGWGYDAPTQAVRLLLDASLTDARSAGDRTVNGAWLDAGCGTGLVGRAARDAGFRGRLTGLDLSATSVGRAARRGAYDDVLISDLQRTLPFADATFDAVLCVGVLSYVPDTGAFWRELCRVLRPGGTLVCTQRSDVWDERRCATTLHELELEGRWTVLHLSPPVDYLPGNADFAHDIGVRYVVARNRGDITTAAS